MPAPIAIETDDDFIFACVMDGIGGTKWSPIGDINNFAGGLEILTDEPVPYLTWIDDVGIGDNLLNLPGFVVSGTNTLVTTRRSGIITARCNGYYEQAEFAGGLSTMTLGSLMEGYGGVGHAPGHYAEFFFCKGTPAENDELNLYNYLSNLYGG